MYSSVYSQTSSTPHCRKQRVLDLTLHTQPALSEYILRVLPVTPCPARYIGRSTHQLLNSCASSFGMTARGSSPFLSFVSEFAGAPGLFSALPVETRKAFIALP